jgi:hypothetical protein
MTLEDEAHINSSEDEKVDEINQFLDGLRVRQRKRIARKMNANLIKYVRKPD